MLGIVHERCKLGELRVPSSPRIGIGACTGTCCRPGVCRVHRSIAWRSHRRKAAWCTGRARHSTDVRYRTTGCGLSTSTHNASPAYRTRQVHPDRRILSTAYRTGAARHLERDRSCRLDKSVILGREAMKCPDTDKHSKSGQWHGCCRRKAHRSSKVPKSWEYRWRPLSGTCQ